MSNCAVFFNTMRTEQKTSVKNSIGRLVFVGISVLLQVIWIINLFLWLNRYSAAISLFSTLIAVSVVFAIYRSVLKLPVMFQKQIRKISLKRYPKIGQGSGECF